MTEGRLKNKVEETKAIAAENGLNLRSAPLLVTFEMPVWGLGLAMGEIGDLSRLPGTSLAVMSPDPLPALRVAVDSAPFLHLIAERGLVLGLSGGATVHVYPDSEREQESFAVALLAGIAPQALQVAVSGYVSSGRQEATFERGAPESAPSPREMLQAFRRQGATAAYASTGEEALVVDDLPSELAAVHRALSRDLPGKPVRVSRLPSGRFRFAPGDAPRPLERERLQVLAQEIAISCDRFLETRGPSTFGFVTEPVARWRYNPAAGARQLAAVLFNAPDTVITQLGLHPFSGEGTLFFAYEGTETVWEAANKGIACITVRDFLEYGRILDAIRRGE